MRVMNDNPVRLSEPKRDRTAVDRRSLQFCWVSIYLVVSVSNPPTNQNLKITVYLTNEKEDRMYAYKIKLPETIPSTVWACKTTVNNYKWKNTNKKNMIELSLCRSSCRRAFLEGVGNFEIEGTCFSCSVGDEKRTSEADEGVSVEILSIALQFDKIDSELCKLDASLPIPDSSATAISISS